MSEGYHIEDELQQKSYDAGLMRRLLGYVRPYRRWMIFAGVLLLIAALLSSLAPLLMMWSVDKYIGNPAHLGEAASPELLARDMHGLLLMILLIALLVVGEGLIRYTQLVIVGIVGQRTLLEMRAGLFAHLQEMPLAFLDKNPLGRLISRVTSDVEKIQQTIVTGVVQIVSDLLTILVVLIFMLATNWQLALVALSPVPFVFIVSVVFRKYAQQSFREIRRKIARVSAYLQENLSGMRIVQMFNRQARNYEEYRIRNADHRDEWLKQVRNFAVYFPAVDFLGALSTALIIYYCGTQMLKLGAAQTGVGSVGTFFGYVMWSERFYGPIRALADRYNLILEAMASSERVFQLLDTPGEEGVYTAPDTVDIPADAGGAVSFRDVSFAYAEGQWVLKHINLEIAPGERVAVVGHTGAGKSTLINLLSRFYDVQEGSIFVDGRDVREYARVALRRRIGVVLQEVFLFTGTIEENIRLGDTEMSDAWIRQCAEYVNAARFIERLPGKYAYQVGERGGNLSTGQRQLLAFARALAHRPHILVLDEATSSVDTETEALIQDAIAKLMAERTAIVIAHRLATVQHADRIVVMHHGEIRESGTHQELLAQGGLYRKLYELQYKDQAVSG